MRAPQRSGLASRPFLEHDLPLSSTGRLRRLSGCTCPAPRRSGTGGNAPSGVGISNPYRAREKHRVTFGFWLISSRACGTSPYVERSPKSRRRTRLGPDRGMLAQTSATRSQEIGLGVRLGGRGQRSVFVIGVCRPFPARSAPEPRSLSATTQVVTDSSPVPFRTRLIAPLPPVLAQVSRRKGTGPSGAPPSPSASTPRPSPGPRRLALSRLTAVPNICVWGLTGPGGKAARCRCC